MGKVKREGTKALEMTCTCKEVDRRTEQIMLYLKGNSDLVVIK